MIFQIFPLSMGPLHQYRFHGTTGVGHKFKEAISKIFQEEAKKFSEISSNFKNKYFEDVSIEAIYTNEPIFGKLITKTKL